MIPWFQYNIWQIGPVPIQVWGFFVALGMLVSIAILWSRAPKFGIDREKIVNQTLWMVILGLVFARIFHVVFYEPAYFLANPVDIIKIWQGGLSSFGGFFGAALGFAYYLKKGEIAKKSFWKIADLLSFSALFGWIIGRIGCFMIHDHLGRKSDFFLAINKPDGPRLEMALLEMIGLLPLAILFFINRNKKKSEGWFFSILFVYYGALRFVLDFFRATDIATPDVRYLGLTPGQYFAILMFGIGLLSFRAKRGIFRR